MPGFTSTVWYIICKAVAGGGIRAAYTVTAANIDNVSIPAGNTGFICTQEQYDAAKGMLQTSSPSYGWVVVNTGGVFSLAQNNGPSTGNYQQLAAYGEGSVAYPPTGNGYTGTFNGATP